MTSDPRFVLDTGVLISAALLPRSIPRRAVDLAFAQGTVLASVDTIDELDRVLRRPKFDRYLREEERLLFLAAFIRYAKIVGVVEKLTECRDPKDNKFLELAVSGNATSIISGDNDLLILNPFCGVTILTPQQFVSESERGVAQRDAQADQQPH